MGLAGRWIGWIGEWILGKGLIDTPLFSPSLSLCVINLVLIGAVSPYSNPNPHPTSLCLCQPIHGRPTGVDKNHKKRVHILGKNERMKKKTTNKNAPTIQPKKPPPQYPQTYCTVTITREKKQPSDPSRYHIAPTHRYFHRFFEILDRSKKNNNRTREGTVGKNTARKKQEKIQRPFQPFFVSFLSLLCDLLSRLNEPLRPCLPCPSRFCSLVYSFD